MCFPINITQFETTVNRLGYLTIYNLDNLVMLYALVTSVLNVLSVI